MAVLKVTESNFSEIKNSGKTVLLDFYADWCMPCRMMGPVVEELEEERTDCIAGKVNVDEESALAQMFGVESIPMLVVLKDGKIADKTVGVCSKEKLAAMLDV